MGKNVKLTIRLSQEDMTLLKSHTAKTRLSQSAYLRMLIRGYVPKSYPPEMFYDLMQRLNQSGGKIDAAVLNGVRQLQEVITAPEKIE